MGLFGKKDETPKPKTAEQIRKENEEFEKRQVEMLIALRTKSELKIEKSAIVTLSQMADVVRSQTIINKSLQGTIKSQKVDLNTYNTEIISLLKMTFDNVDSMKAHVKILVDKHSAKMKD